MKRDRRDEESWVYDILMTISFGFHWNTNRHQRKEIPYFDMRTMD